MLAQFRHIERNVALQKKLLITGASGFAGHYLAPLMADRGYQVFGTGCHHTQAVDGVDHIYPLDLTDEAQVYDLVETVRPAAVAHLAALSFVGHGDVAEIYRTNIVGTRNLLAALSGCTEKPEVTMLTSSATVYGNTSSGSLSEVDPLKPANDYAVSKLAMEYMSSQFADQLNLVTVRPFNYTGRGQSTNFLIPKIVEHFRARAPFIELGNTDVARDFSDVRDVAEYMSRLLDRRTSRGGLFNICSGGATSLQQIIETCQDITGHSMEVRVNKAFQRPNEVKLSVGDPSRLHQAVGKVLNHNVRDMLEWMLSV